MTDKKWQTPKQLKELLVELVGWRSVTQTDDEKQFPYRLQEKLRSLDYFQAHPEQISFFNIDPERPSVSALYLNEKATKTVVLFGHFDTVPIEDFGEQKAIATHPDLITQYFEEHVEDAPENVQDDIRSGDYIFGRGIMDMKAGIALNLQTLEKAILEDWALNIVFLAVGDEEVNSEGMRAASPHLLELKDKYELDYQMGILSEPVFRNNPNDDAFSVYTGTVGKVLLTALVVGKETHAGEPLSGITSSYLSSFLTQQMEWNSDFVEEDHGERMQPPVVLQQKDLVDLYSVQTPLRTSILFNAFQMKRSIAELFDLFEKNAKIAAEKANVDYVEKCDFYNIESVGEVNVIRYEDLLAYATKKMGAAWIEKTRVDIEKRKEGDVRDKSLMIADQLMMACKELAPTMVLLLAPPYYPAVSFSGDPFIEECNEKILNIAKEVVSIPAERKHYFNGLCDMSYVAYNGDESEYEVFENNAPILGNLYDVPFKEMQELNLPTMVVGPYGKDPHKRYERLHKKNAFEEMPILYERFLKSLIENN